MISINQILIVEVLRSNEIMNFSPQTRKIKKFYYILNFRLKSLVSFEEYMADIQVEKLIQLITFHHLNLFDAIISTFAISGKLINNKWIFEILRAILKLRVPKNYFKIHKIKKKMWVA